MKTDSQRSWKIFDYVNARGKNEIKRWIKGLEKAHRIRLNQKLDMLKKVGPELPPQLLAGPIFDHIYKLRITSNNVQLRPLLCKGPIDNAKEFTLLLGAYEVGDEFQPKDAPQRAARNREVIIENPTRRREHERVK